MKKFFLLFLSMVCGVLFAADYKDAKSAMAAAKTFEQEKKVAEAVEAYQAAAKLYPKAPNQVDALRKAARLLASNKQNAEAIAVLKVFAEDASKPASQRTIAYMECARASLTDEEKLGFFEKGIELKAGDWTEGGCVCGKADVLVRAKKYDDAAGLYKQVAENTKYNGVTRGAAYNGLINYAIRKKDYAAAHAYCATMREVGKERYAFLISDANQHEARVFRAERKYDEAVKLFLEAAADTKVNARGRGRALEQVVVIEMNDRKNEEAAKKALELFKTYGIPMTDKCKQIEAKLNGAKK